MQPHPAPAILNLIPLLFMSLIWGIFFMSIAKRKGQNPFLTLVVCFIPLIGFLWGLYILSIPDYEIKQGLANLRQEIEKLKKG